jgi:hypothetical protein
MTASALRALAFAERYGVTIAVVAGDRLRWQSQGPTPGRALKALKAAKGELIDLLVRYRLDPAGGLAGDDLLAALQAAGFVVRRYGAQAALDDDSGQGRVPPMPLLYRFSDKQAEFSLALRALRAPDWLERNARALRQELAVIGTGADETDEEPSATMRASELLGHLRDLGFRAHIDRGELYLADKTGWRRDLSRFISPTLVFEVLNATRDDDLARMLCAARDEGLATI